MDDFMIRAMIAGLGVACASGPLGVFVVWRRLSYFGDTLAHSSLLGVTLGLLLGVPLPLALLFVCLGVAVLLYLLESRSQQTPSDTLLGLLAHTSLALALVAVSLAKGPRVDLNAFLFGDILATSRTDLLWIWGVGGLVLLGLSRLWKPLLNLTVNEPLASVDGVPVARIRLLFMILVAITVAMAMRIVGALLVSALLVIPAAAARHFAATPVAMAWIATAISAVSVLSGLLFSWFWDTPSGPSIVLAAAFLFLAGRVFQTVSSPSG